MTILQRKSWAEAVNARQDPGVTEQIPEVVGPYKYFIQEKAWPASAETYGNSDPIYEVYCRLPNETFRDHKMMN